MTLKVNIHPSTAYADVAPLFPDSESIPPVTNTSKEVTIGRHRAMHAVSSMSPIVECRVTLEVGETSSVEVGTTSYYDFDNNDVTSVCATTEQAAPLVEARLP